MGGQTPHPVLTSPLSPFFLCSVQRKGKLLNLLAWVRTLVVNSDRPRWLKPSVRSTFSQTLQVMRLTVEGGGRGTEVAGGCGSLRPHPETAPSSFGGRARKHSSTPTSLEGRQEGTVSSGAGEKVFQGGLGFWPWCRVLESVLLLHNECPPMSVQSAFL